MAEDLKIAIFVRQNIEHGYRQDGMRKKSPSELRDRELVLSDDQFDSLTGKIRSDYHTNSTKNAQSYTSSIKESPCEIGYVKSGRRWDEFLINGAIVYLIQDYEGLDGETGRDNIRNSLVLCHETEGGLAALLENLGLNTQNQPISN